MGTVQFALKGTSAKFTLHEAEHRPNIQLDAEIHNLPKFAVESKKNNCIVYIWGAGGNTYKKCFYLETNENNVFFSGKMDRNCVVLGDADKKGHIIIEMCTKSDVTVQLN